MSFMTNFPKSGKLGSYNYYVQVDCRNSTEHQVADLMKEDYCKNNQAFVCKISDLNVTKNPRKKAAEPAMRYIAKSKQNSSNQSSGSEREDQFFAYHN